MTTELIAMLDAPAIEGVTFRPFRGESDYPHIVAIDNACFAAGGFEFVNTVEETANEFAHLVGCDPYRDLIFVEAAGGQPVGYVMTDWSKNDAGEQIFWQGGWVLPEWRGKGIGTALIRWVESRARENAAANPHDGPRFMQSWTAGAMPDRTALLQQAGYRAVRYGYQMLRSLSEPIPDLPLPEDVEVRPATREHYRPIWEARNEAFRDHWGHREGTEEDFQAFLNWPLAQPALWQVAWDTAKNEVAGQVQVTIFEADNKKFGFKRGFTDPIFVRRPWRKQGLAKALIARALRVLKDKGMDEAALFVDAENPNGALKLYQGLGYRVYRETFTYRKSLNSA
jgi:GNAT superfamily N-acetyltransferase